MFVRLLSVVVVATTASFVSADSYYLALGDSVAFGYENTQSPFVQSNGDRGYVAPVANALGALTGVRPSVLNLAIAGETSTSYMDTSILYAALNSNYPLAGRPSQDAFATAKLSTLGSQIGTVSFAIGANDYLGLSAQQQANPVALAQLLVKIQTRYLSVLTTIRDAIPGARLLLPGYYNPYTPGTAPHDRAALALVQLNTIIQGDATQFGGQYVDFYTPIEGNQSTLIGAGDIHPNDAGYAVLGRAAAQAVPEPGTWAALGLGTLALLRRRRRDCR